MLRTTPTSRIDRQSQTFFRGLRLSAILLAMAIVTGVIGFSTIENYTLTEAFYMTIITLSTVGFTEVRPLSDMGRIFASLLIIGNIGIFAYAVTNISRFLVEGGLKKLFQYRAMEKKIAQLKDHVIICGYGRYGQEIAEHFNRHKVPFVVIDNRQETIDDLHQRENTPYLQGDATNDETLEEAGIERASALIAALPEDTDNVYVVLTARQLKSNLKIISRATYQKAERKLKRAGADHVILPNQIGGFYMATLVTKPDAVEFFTILTEKGDELVSFEEVIFDSLPEGKTKQTIKELNIRKNTGANVVGLKTPDGQYIVNPSADTVIEINMGIIVLGTEEQIASFKDYMTRLIHPEERS